MIFFIPTCLTLVWIEYRFNLKIDICQATSFMVDSTGNILSIYVNHNENNFKNTIYVYV